MSPKPLTGIQMQRLLKPARLAAKGSRKSCGPCVMFRSRQDPDRIIMINHATKATHSLDVSSTNLTRLNAHWKGFCNA